MTTLHPIAQQGERDDREDHARHGRRKQDEQPKLYNTDAATTQGVLHDAADRTLRAGLGAEHVIVLSLATILEKIVDAAEGHDGGHGNDADAEQVADQLFDTLVASAGVVSAWPSQLSRQPVRKSSRPRGQE